MLIFTRIYVQFCGRLGIFDKWQQLTYQYWLLTNKTPESLCSTYSSIRTLVRQTLKFDSVELDSNSTRNKDRQDNYDWMEKDIHKDTFCYSDYLSI